jgi:hypothetical protein
VSCPQWKLDEAELGSLVAAALEEEEFQVRQRAWEAYWASLTPDQRRAEIDMMDTHAAGYDREDWS